MRYFIFPALALLIFCNQGNAQKSKSSPVSDTTVSFLVEGLCSMCKDRIENAAQAKGVKHASWNQTTRQLQLVLTPAANIEKIKQHILDAGHDLEDRKADDAVYNALPACCHYRNPQNEAHSDDSLVAANTLNGVVLQEDNKGVFQPLVNASIIWLKSGKGTTTNASGVFSMPWMEGENQVVVSYVGYKADTMPVSESEPLMVVLASNGTLQDVKVTARQRSLYISTTSAIRTQVMTEKELFKAACCNLSESFETNPSVDVAYNDAVTGSKQIQLLGLSGNYTQLTVESLPGPRGLATTMGLNYIPGPWVESIQLTKGPGSVVNGFESIAGQINVELKKPESAEKIYANGYVNSGGKTDINLTLTQKVGQKWSTALLLHDNFLDNKMDFNKDGFRDLPTGNLFTAMNRWKYEGTNGWMAQFGAKLLTDRKTGGALNFDPDQDKLNTDVYGLGFNTDRYEGFVKVGYVFPAQKYKSIGLQVSGFSHKQDSYFGTTLYYAFQRNAYANLIYQSIINNTNHKFRTGLSLVNDRYEETLRQQSFDRTETVPGGFFEYTYDYLKKFTLVAGIRVDHHNLFGWFATPRLHLRFQPWQGTTFRLSGGRGQRTANIIAENTSLLVTSRSLTIQSADPGKAYGLDPETAWTGGLSIDQKLRMFGRDASFAVDYFYNHFQNQVVVDLENPREVNLYNLRGKSYANSLQAAINFVPLHQLEVRMAWRLFDVRTTYGNKLLQRPLLSRNRGFINLAYETGGWKFDYTLNYNSRKRLPSTESNPTVYRAGDYSPSFFLMNAQVSKTFGKQKQLEWYIGGENLTNYFQQNAIIAADDPFGPYFDAALVWGPVTGTMIYTGFRFKLK